MSSECPHCFNEMDPRATVCGKCGATMRRGASFSDVKAGGFLGSLSGLVIGGMAGGMDGALPGTLAGIFVGIVLVIFIRGNKKIWTRNYHD